MNVRTAFSCNFERDECGFSSSHKWRLSRGAAEKELEPDGFAQPPRGFRRNDQFIYSVVKNLPGGSYGKSLAMLSWSSSFIIFFKLHFL